MFPFEHRVEPDKPDDVIAVNARSITETQVYYVRVGPP